MNIPKSLNNLKSLIGSHKLISFLLLILLLVVGQMAWGKYQDWENAKMIKGLARDFQILIAEIEKETGLELEIKTNCMTTQEKYGSGISTCEAVVSSPANQKLIDTTVDTFFESENFEKSEYNPVSVAYRVAYKGKNSCTIGGNQKIYISCQTGVRDVNKNLATLEFTKIRD